jgi:hypothetical protein
MKAKTLQIDQLRLRVNGISGDQARRLGKLVAARLAGPALSTQRTGRLSSLTVSVPASGNISLDRMADLITERVVRSLK